MLQRGAVQVPDRIGDTGAVIIDRHVVGTEVPGQVDFTDYVDRMCGDGCHRFERGFPMIDLVDVEVIDVE